MPVHSARGPNGGIERGGERPLNAAKRQLRVRFLADRLPVGGAERVLQTLCTQLPRLGIETGLSTLRDPGPVGLEIAAAGIPVVGQVSRWPSSPAALPELVSHLRGLQCDLLYVLDHSNALFLGRLAGRLAGVPHQICAVHRTRRADGSPSLGWHDRLLMPLSDVVVAVSEGQARYLETEARIAPDRVRVIYNGVAVPEAPRRLTELEFKALREELGIAGKERVVAIVAALRPEKNHELLFAALAELPSELETVLLVIGGGAREEELRRRSQSLGIESQIRWLGVRDNVPRILAVADVLALSSHPVVETFPLCVLEGMAAALPVVSTRVGSLEEMVVEGETGLLIPPGDVDAMAAALAALLQDPRRSEVMGEAGRVHALRNFDRRFMVEGTARLIRTLAAG